MRSRLLLSEPLAIERLAIAIADLPPDLEGTKLVQLSDFHYNEQLEDWLLGEAIEASNAEDPDLVVLTGDFVTDDPEPIHGLTPFLQRLKYRHGIYAVLGNHDMWFKDSRAIVTKALEAAGIPVLWNQVAYPFGDRLPLVGLADFWSGEFDPNTPLDSLDPSVPRIVLSHNPDTARILKKWRVDLQLSGHTHGGQIVLPLLGPLPAYIEAARRVIPKPILPFVPILANSFRVVDRWEWASGWHQIGTSQLGTNQLGTNQLGTNQLYVNRGLGSYQPGRLFCPPEVTVITLIAAQ